MYPALNTSSLFLSRSTSSRIVSYPSVIRSGLSMLVHRYLICSEIPNNLSKSCMVRCMLCNYLDKVEDI